MRNFVIEDQTFRTPQNPCVGRPTPVVLVPKDVLSQLPVAESWNDIADAAAKTAAIRDRINLYIGNLWNVRVRRDKERLRAKALQSKPAVEALIAAIRSGKKRPYDFGSDPDSLRKWYEAARTLAKQNPVSGLPSAPWDGQRVKTLVRTIVRQYKFLIEKKGLWEILWNKTKPCHENVAQKLFLAVADSYCCQNGTDVTPEADTGTGVVDFKFSTGYASRVLVEIKLSRNPKLVNGFEKQLEAYKESEQTTHGTYVVVDVGSIGRKKQRIAAIARSRKRSHKPVSEVVFIEGQRRKSVSVTCSTLTRNGQGRS